MTWNSIFFQQKPDLERKVEKVKQQLDSEPDNYSRVNGWRKLGEIIVGTTAPEKPCLIRYCQRWLDFLVSLRNLTSFQLIFRGMDCVLLVVVGLQLLYDSSPQVLAVTSHKFIQASLQFNSFEALACLAQFLQCVLWRSCLRRIYLNISKHYSATVQPSHVPQKSHIFIQKLFKISPWILSSGNYCWSNIYCP